MSNATCAAVVIGRNEGVRLVTCLESLLKSLDCIVYVDSGSSDNSLLEASGLDVDCVSLDLSIPFTAARARNEGSRYLLKNYPSLEYIQFVDGDCEVKPKWVKLAQDFLDNESSFAVVCGRRRERFPEQSIYNRLCDVEWNTPVGDAMACGGDAMVRVDAFKQVDGYRDDLIAGEEPEMCFRLRSSGWKIGRIDVEMVLHDANITKVSQWWSRAKRSGYAYAEGCYLHGRSVERYNVKQVLSVLTWAFLLPLFITVTTAYDVRFLALMIVYPLQVLRLSIKNKDSMNSFLTSASYALFNVAGKYPQAAGMFKFVMNKLQNRHATLIEYK